MAAVRTRGRRIFDDGLGVRPLRGSGLLYLGTQSQGGSPTSAAEMADKKEEEEEEEVKKQNTEKSTNQGHSHGEHGGGPPFQ